MEICSDAGLERLKVWPILPSQVEQSPKLIPMKLSPQLPQSGSGIDVTLPPHTDSQLYNPARFSWFDSSIVLACTVFIPGSLTDPTEIRMGKNILYLSITTFQQLE